MIHQTYSEVKTLDFALGYTDDNPVEKELNEHLAKGWELIALINDLKYNPQYECAVSNNYAVVGKPRIQRHHKKS